MGLIGKCNKFGAGKKLLCYVSCNEKTASEGNSEHLLVGCKGFTIDYDRLLTLAGLRDYRILNLVVKAMHF